MHHVADTVVGYSHQRPPGCKAGNVSTSFTSEIGTRRHTVCSLSWQDRSVAEHYHGIVIVTVLETGVLTQVNPAKGNFSQVAGRELELVQWHFHTPSEHAFDGNRKSIEAHLVHKDTKTGMPPPVKAQKSTTLLLLGLPKESAHCDRRKLDIAQLEGKLPCVCKFTPHHCITFDCWSSCLALFLVTRHCATINSHPPQSLSPSKQACKTAGAGRSDQHPARAQMGFAFTACCHACCTIHQLCSEMCNI